MSNAVAPSNEAGKQSSGVHVADKHPWMWSRPPDAVPLSAVRRVLIIKLRHLGDVLLTSPVFSTLARAAPHAEIDALIYRDTAPMLANHPSISVLHTVDREWKRQGLVRQLTAEVRLLRTLRARRYDLLMHLTEHRRGLVFVRALRPRYAVTPERKDLRWRRYFTHFYQIPPNSPRHTVETDLDSLRRIGVNPEPADKKLVLIPGTAAEAIADALLAYHELRRGEFVQVHPGSRWLFKSWPAQRMAALLDRIVAGGLPIIVTGARDADEQALVSEMLAACKPQTRARVKDLTGTLTLLEVAALTARARVFVGVDSAPMHIAAAMGTPAIALFGPSDEHVWGPWRVKHRVVVSDAHPCRPCDLDGCGGGKVSECLTTLSVDKVYAAFASLIEQTA